MWEKVGINGKMVTRKKQFHIKCRVPIASLLGQFFGNISKGMIVWKTKKMYL